MTGRRTGGDATSAPWTRRTVLASGAAAAFGMIPGRSLDAKEPPPIERPIMGDVAAPKRLVVWGSCTCAFTAQLYVILKQIVQDMPRVASVEWRHFPLHQPDPALHVGSLGFKGDHFWGFVFRVLGVVLEKGGDYAGLTPEKLGEFAQAEGGSAATLKEAQADPAKWAMVKQDLLAGHFLGITATPGLFYNGFFLTPGGIPLDKKAFDASLRGMLKS